jgi:hypothetical protein
VGDQLQGYWWCPQCKQKIWPEEVTYEEYHEVCGTPVIWVRPPDPIDTLQTELETVRAEVEKLRAEVERLRRREETILRWLDDSCCPPRMLGSRCPERACGECFREALDIEEAREREKDGGRESA